MLMKSIAFGTHLPVMEFIREQTTTKEELIRYAQRSEELGYDSLSVNDHLVFRTGWLDAISSLSAVAATTNKIKIGTSILNIVIRNPVICAKALTSIDILSSGRLFAGLGPGSYRGDYDACGIPFEDRWKRFSEALEVMHALWNDEAETKPSSVDYEGKYYKLKGVSIDPKPLQKPHPPIIVGGTGEKYLLKIVAKHADIYNNPFGSPADIRKKLTVLKEHCHDLRKSYNNIELSVLLPCIIKESEKDVLIEINKWKKKNENISAFLERKSGGYTIGTPEKILLGLQQYIDLGITHFILNFIGLEDYTLHLFDSRVVKKL